MPFEFAGISVGRWVPLVSFLLRPVTFQDFGSLPRGIRTGSWAPSRWGFEHSGNVTTFSHLHTIFTMVRFSTTFSYTRMHQSLCSFLQCLAILLNVFSLVLEMISALRAAPLSGGRRSRRG